MAVQIQYISLGIQDGMSYTNTWPLLGIVWMASREIPKAYRVVKVIQELGIFELSNENAINIAGALSMPPLAISLIIECVPEEYQDRCEESYLLFQRLVRTIYMVSLGVGLIKSIKNRQILPFCYHSSAFVGGLLTLGKEQRYLSQTTHNTIRGIFVYLELLTSVHVSENTELRIVIIIIVSWLRLRYFGLLLRLEQTRVERNIAQGSPSLPKRVFNVCFRSSFSGFRHPFSGPEMRNGEVNDNPYMHMVKQFGTNEIQHGIRFLQTEIYDKMDVDTKKLFEESAPEIIPYVLSKAVYLYAFGECKSKAIPQFFKEETRILLISLRAQILTKEEADWLEKHFSTLENYNQEIPKEYQALHTQIGEAGSEELQQGMLLISCWEKVKIDPSGRVD